MDETNFDFGFFIIIAIFVIIAIIVESIKNKRTGTNSSSKTTPYYNQDDAIEEIVCAYDNHVKHTGYVNPNVGKLHEELIYRQIKRALERKKTYEEMQNLMHRLQNSITSEMYFRLNNDLEAIRAKRKLY